MAKTKPGTLTTNETTVVRTATGAPVEADSTTLSDANFVPGDAVIGGGWRRVCVHPRFTGGTSPTVVLQPLYRMGSAWVAGSKSTALTEKEGFWIDVMGREFFLRVDTVTGDSTAIALHCAGWEPFKYDGAHPG